MEQLTSSNQDNDLVIVLLKKFKLKLEISFDRDEFISRIKDSEGKILKNLDLRKDSEETPTMQSILCEALKWLLWKNQEP